MVFTGALGKLGEECNCFTFHSVCGVLHSKGRDLKQVWYATRWPHVSPYCSQYLHSSLYLNVKHIKKNRIQHILMLIAYALYWDTSQAAEKL